MYDELWRIHTERELARSKALAAIRVRDEVVEWHQYCWSELTWARRAFGHQIKKVTARYESALRRNQAAERKVRGRRSKEEYSRRRPRTSRVQHDDDDAQRLLDERQKLTTALDAAQTQFDAATQALHITRESTTPLEELHEQAYGRFESALKSRGLRFDEYKELLGRRVGVPAEFVSDYELTVKPDGVMHFYFGGNGNPAGDGHAHYIVQKSGYMTYRREPHAARGKDNRLIPPVLVIQRHTPSLTT